jgi:hypothetical protein
VLLKNENSSYSLGENIYNIIIGARIHEKKVYRPIVKIYITQ